MATQGLKLPSYLEEQLSAVSPVNNTDNSPKENTLTLPKYLSEEPSTVRKLQYGAAEETYLLGDIWRLTESAIKAIGPDTFKEAREDVEEDRLKKLYAEFPEFETGQYDNDAAVWGGRAAIMVSDPLYLLMPWARAAQAGKLIGKGGLALAGLGAGVGVTDATIRGLARDGEVSGKQVGYSALAGGLLSPAALGVQKLGGIGLNKMFPNLFKNKTKIQSEEITNTLRNNFKNKYNLNDVQLDNVYKISSLPKIRQLFDDIVTSENNYKNLILPRIQLLDKLNKVTNNFSKSVPLRPDQLTTIIKQLPGGNKIKFKSIGDKTLLTATQAEKKIITKNIKTEIDDVINASIKDQARRNHLYQVEVIKQIHKAGGLKSAVGRALAINLTRPVVGAGAGAVTGTIFTDSDEGFNKMVMIGAGVGFTHRVLMRGGIKGIPKPEQISFANIMKKEFWTNLDRKIRIGTSQTLQSKLTNRGPVLDEFSNLLFSRPTDTVRLDWLGRVAKNQDETIGIIGTGRSVEEVAEKRIAGFVGSIYDDVLGNSGGQIQADALSIVRGSKEKFSDEAVALSGRIKNWLNDFRTYYKDVGFTDAQLIDNYFPRKFNYKQILQSDASKEQFLQTVTQVFKNLTKNASAKNPVKVGMSGTGKPVLSKKKFNDTEARQAAEKYFRSITDSHENPILDFAKLERGEVLNYKNITLPLSEHIRYERILQGSFDDVEKLLQPYLINDVGAVLTDLIRTSAKSVEFARVFGPKGELIGNFAKRLSTQYEQAGFTKIGGFYGSEHRLDAEAIKNAVNAYFGRYGKSGGPTSRSIGAVLSTLANFNMMDKVTLANLGDLIQPFQNSRYFASAIQGFGFYSSPKFSNQLNLIHTKIAQANLKDAYMGSTGSSPLTLESGLSGSISSFLGKSNEKFFKLIGLEGITNVARRYAYNVGVIDAHKTIRKIVTTLDKKGINNINLQNADKTLLKDIRHLVRTGTIRLNKQGQIVNNDDIFFLGRIKNLEDALVDKRAANLIDNIGLKAANRDALIPQVGNRLLFTQDKNPFIRMLGQFSSWAMAKSAQTNAMLQRVEDGDLRTAIGLVASLGIFGAVQDLRDFAKTGKFNTYEQIDDDPAKWLSDAFIMSGNMGWLPTSVINQIIGYGNDAPILIGPGYNVAFDWTKAVAQTGDAFLNKKSYDAAIRNFYKNAPIPTIRGILDRVGVPYMTYKKDSNLFKNSSGITSNMFNKGGVADKTRMLFNEGDVADKSFSDSFAEARNNKQELFTWQGNSYTTRRADESDQQYKNYLGVTKIDGPQIVLKEKPLAPANNEQYNETVKGYDEIQNTIVPKKKPILKAKEDKGFKFPSIIGSAEASIVEQPEEKIKAPVAVENFAKEENENTEVISAPFRLLANSFWNKWFGKKEGEMFTNNDFDKGTVNVLEIVAKSALNDGRNYSHYTDYPLTKRGVSAEALVGEYKDKNGKLYSKEYKKKLEDEVNAIYPNNILGKAKFAYDIATDPVMKAIFSIGGFSLQKDNQGYFINERFNFNTANKTEGTALKKIRKVISNMKDAPMDENEGPEVFIKLGNIKDNKVALKMAKGDTPSVAWMRDYFFDGKGGYDSIMTFPEFIKGPGKALYLDSRNKSKGGVIRKHFRYGGDTMGGPNDKSNAGQGSGSQGPAGGQSSGGNYGGGNNNNNNNNNNGSTARERYIATQYNKTKTKTKGATNGGSGSNNNNNTSNTNKNNKTDTKDKRKESTYVTRGPYTKYNIDNPIDINSILNPSEISVAGEGGYKISKDIYSPTGEVVGNVYSTKAYLQGDVNLQGDTNQSFNIDFSNQKGYDATASYDLDNSILSGNVSKYTDIGNTGYKVGVGVDYNDGDIGPSFQIKKSFKKGGLLDKKRG